MNKNKGKNKKSTTETLATIADDYNDVLAFLQSAAVKSSRVVLAPLSLRADKHERIWFRRWSETNLPTPTKTSPQNHTGIMRILSDLATRL